MINFNGKITDLSDQLINNRAFLYGDAVFETLIIFNDKILFWEDHYFRLMSSMRIIRLDIPDKYTPEFFKENIIKIHNSISQTRNSRIRINIFRFSGGKYKPKKNTPSFIISCESINYNTYELNKGHYEVDLYKDYYLDNQLISSIKTNNKIINVVASIYASENGFDNCILLNKDKLVSEFINSNLFIIKDEKIYTPTLKSGCLNGVLRKNLFKILSSSSFELCEQDLSTFDITQSDEIFGTNIAQGIFSVTKFRKKDYDCSKTKKIITMLNNFIS
jgi:branched-chain amino acid aminotransferase|tara:strand:- start:35 stop:862 length:828 start_codon:yes stop_codon:yes gene_type:complete